MKGEALRKTEKLILVGFSPENSNKYVLNSCFVSKSAKNKE